MTSTIYKEVLAALRFEYAAEHNGKEPGLNAIYWQYVAEKIFEGFHDAHDDMCFEWLMSLIDKHKPAILAAFPQWADDEDSLLYQDE